jgi:hypothetical protein
MDPTASGQRFVFLEYRAIRSIFVSDLPRKMLAFAFGLSQYLCTKPRGIRRDVVNAN